MGSAVRSSYGIALRVDTLQYILMVRMSLSGRTFFSPVSVATGPSIGEPLLVGELCHCLDFDHVAVVALACKLLSTLQPGWPQPQIGIRGGSV